MYVTDESNKPKMVGFDLFGLAQVEEINVYPECELAFVTFSKLRTQWRVGMGGPTGLDYTAVLALIRAMRLPREQSDELFEDIQTMEFSALTQIAENHERSK